MAFASTTISAGSTCSAATISDAPPERGAPSTVPPSKFVQYTWLPSTATPAGPCWPDARTSAAPPTFGTLITEPSVQFCSVVPWLTQYTCVASMAMLSGDCTSDASTVTVPPPSGTDAIPPYAVQKTRLASIATRQGNASGTARVSDGLAPP